jgi:membrane protein DedA with SNARE-associated domain
MLGSIIGYWLGRAIPVPPAAAAAPAPPIARFTGPIALAATRAIPVLSEAGIIAAGAARMDFRRVLLIIAPANLAVAFAYAGAGTLLAGVDPALAAICATCLCAAAWAVSLAVRRWRAPV